jgi:hypothetical protein
MKHACYWEEYEGTRANDLNKQALICEAWRLFRQDTISMDGNLCWAAKRGMLQAAKADGIAEPEKI